MIRRPPRSTLDRSSAASDVYKRQAITRRFRTDQWSTPTGALAGKDAGEFIGQALVLPEYCLLYTSDAADERSSVDLGGRRIIKKKKSALTHMNNLTKK